MKDNNDMNRSTGNPFTLVSKYRGAVMGFAALWILMFHDWVYLFSDHPILLTIEGGVKIVGFCGVDIFFLLSGLGLTFSIRKGLKAFWLGRIRRLILPILTVAVIRTFTDHWTALDFVKNVTGFTFWTENIYTFLWFVMAIGTLYLLFPLYWRFYSRSKSPLFFTVGAIFVWLLAIMLTTGRVRYEMYGFFNRIPVFLVGVQFGYMTQHSDVRFTRTHYLALAVIFLNGLYFAYGTNVLGLTGFVPLANCFFPNLLLAVSVTFLLPKALEMLSKWKIGRGLARVLAFYGAMSLEFYLFQERVAAKLVEVLPPLIGEALSNVVILASVTLLAYLAHLAENGFWKLWDRLFHAKKVQKSA